MSKIGVIAVQDFEKAVEVFGFDSPVVTAIWNTMAGNPNNAEEFETVYALNANGRYTEHKTLMEKKDFHGWTEDKAWVVGNELTATVEFDNDEPMQFSSYDEACDWLYERGYRI